MWALERSTLAQSQRRLETPSTLLVAPITRKRTLRLSIPGQRAARVVSSCPWSARGTTVEAGVAGVALCCCRPRPKEARGRESLSGCGIAPEQVAGDPEEEQVGWAGDGRTPLPGRSAQSG